ncbi:hypothetical protein PIB30_088268 [Stylosanthes scabra]|uniref:Peptidase A2 domain-containing protein n=1 Tax=Stylosanthes scabra TaxID=79078 RepID=A0ABU6RUZ0_9FABA|nr:hypothetical protein [Stylosanthes scabra]
MVISAKLGSGLIRRILVDTGANSNIMFRNDFDALGLKNGDMKTHQPGVMGLGDHFIKPDGSWKIINDFSGAMFTKFLVMKYEADSGMIGTLFGDREVPKVAGTATLPYENDPETPPGPSWPT